MDRFENIRFLYDVEVKMSVVLGQVYKNFEYLLGMEEGDIIELNKNIEDYLDVYLNDVKFGKGEMVIVNEKLSIRLIDLVK